MKMKRCTAAILLMLSLEALFAGRLSAAVADDGTIRLPSQECQLKFKFPLCASHNGVRNGGPGVAGHADEGTAAAVGRPCCAWDNTGCRFTLPPCPVGSGDDARNSEAASEKNLAGATGGEVVGARPWKCCDLPLCTKAFPPTCRCLDKVKRCAKTSKVCEKADASNRAAAAPSYVCRDWYGGWAGPSCTKPPVAADVRPGN